MSVPAFPEPEQKATPNVTKTILLTGGAGFIGSNLVSWFREHRPDHKLIVLDALTYAGSLSNLPSDGVFGDDPLFEFWHGSVTNPHLVAALVDRSDIVIHLAAETHVTRSIFDNLSFYETDVIGTQTVASAVLRAGKKIERFIHISTSEVYGSARAPLIDEEHYLDPATPYASAKCGADRLVSSYWNTYDFPGIIVRPFNNYGPRQHLEKLIPRFVTSVLMGEKLRVHGSGSAARDFIHVSDTCRAIQKLIDAPLETVRNQVINLASGVARPVAEIANDIIAKMGVGPDQISRTSDRPGQVERQAGDATRASELLGWKPTVSWSEGLADTIAWYTSNRDWWENQIPMRTVAIRDEQGNVLVY